VVKAAVTLIYFRAIQGTAGITLEWATASELNNAGFYVNRRELPALEYTRITNLIPPEGDGMTGATYDYIDSAVVDGLTYVYLLEMVDTSSVSDFSEPITVTYGVFTPTPTATLTKTETSSGPTQTGTNTPTGTLKTPTQTITNTPTPTSTARTGTPTRTATLWIPTFTQRATNTIQRTGILTITPTPTITSTPTWTATFRPLPKLTLLFPVLSPTNTATLKPTNQATRTQTPVVIPENIMKIDQRFLVVGGIVLLLWLLMGGFLFVYLRRVGY
jgi:hypothetical protein